MGADSAALLERGRQHDAEQQRGATDEVDEVRIIEVLLQKVVRRRSRGRARGQEVRADTAWTSSTTRVSTSGSVCGSTP